uniref:leucine-rich repeat-containing protein 51 n=1 Tax=Pristiophorus japonicus TaxID=55135 RepID=UPI00398F4B97
MAAADTTSTDWVQWPSNHRQDSLDSSLPRNIAWTTNTTDYDSILYGPIVDYSFRNLDTLPDCLKLTPRPGFRQYQYTEDKKLKSCSLRLSNNRLCDLSGLNQLIGILFVEPTRLFWIDLSFNSFPIIDPVLIQCSNLQILNLHGNQISELFQMDKLATLPHMRSLTMHGNPVELMKGYRSYIVGTIPQLKSLDYSFITKQDRSIAAVLKSFTRHKHPARRKYK